MNESQKAGFSRHRRIFTQIFTEYGYGLQYLRGVNRFLGRVPEWVLERGSPDKVHTQDPESLEGALGQFGDPRVDIPYLRAAGIAPIVNSSNRHLDESVHRVFNDERAIGRMAAEYFLRKHFRNFAVLTMPGCHFSELRAQGYCETLADHGIQEVHCRDTQEGFSLCQNSDVYPLALFVVTDHGAQRLLHHLLVEDIRVPQEVAVLGVDDDEVIAPFCAMTMSSVRINGEGIGFAACETLETLMAGGDAPEEQLFAPLGIAERRSTEAVAVADPLVRRAQAYIEEHLLTLSDVVEIADALHIHRRSLDRAFRTATGMTPFDWLTQRRVKRAEQLLRATDFTMALVAERSGFGEYERMLRGFKKAGLPTPGKIRSAECGVRNAE